MTTLTKAQLNQILSALDNQPRNPNTKDAALKAIGRHGECLGLKLDDILSAAAGLLDGRISAAEWCAQLQEPEQPAEEPAELVVENSLAKPASEPVTETAEDEPVEATIMPCAEPLAQAPKLRNGTKQALMIDMLRRPQGATVEQIAEATGWARHTVRGAMAGALKKKLGLTITSEKTEGAARTYHIAD